MWMCGWRGRRFISDGKVGGGVLREGFEVVGEGSKWWEGAFSFPIKFGWCSVLGKQKKLVSGRQSRGMMTVGEKRVFRRELVKKTAPAGAGVAAAES